MKKVICLVALTILAFQALAEDQQPRSVVFINYSQQKNFVFEGQQVTIAVPLTSTGAIDWDAAVGNDGANLGAFLSSEDLFIEIDGRIHLIPGSSILEALVGVGYGVKIGGTPGFDPYGGPYLGVGLNAVLNDTVVLGAKLTQGLQGPPRILFTIGLRLPQ